MAGRPSRVHAFVAGVLVAACLMVAAAFLVAPPAPMRAWWAAALVFGLTFAVAEFFPIPLLGRGGEGVFTMSAAPAYALLLTVPPPVALVLLAAAVLVVDLWPGHRRPLVRAVFNAAQTVLCFGLGGAVLLVVGELPADTITFGTVLALVASGAVMFLVNEGLTSTVIGLDLGMPIGRIVRDNLALNDLVTHYLFLALAPMLVVVWNYDPALLPILMVVMFATHRASREGIAAHTRALHDPLTGLPNRLAFDERVAQLLRQADEQDTLSVLLLDLDRFHLVNDQIGRHIGDGLLIQVARRLAASSEVDTVARLGGDEFAALVRRCDDARLVDVAESLVAAVRQPYVVEDIPLQVDASVGIATAPGDGTDAESLLRVADAALATAKRLGPVPHVHLSDRRSARQRLGRLSLLAEFEHALEAGRLRLDYQPQVATTSGAVVGFEGLLRWHHPVHGEIAPGVFVGALEHTDLMPALTRFVIGTALADLAELRRTGFDGTMSVNVSARDLQDRHLVTEVAAALARHDVPAQALTVEVTENAFVTDPERASRILHDLRDLGVGRAIDDFGTGYSSLSSLRELPLSELKIDRSFVTGLAAGATGVAILEAIIELAARLGLVSVAEGVETEHERTALRRLRCRRLQGYLLARPMHRDTVPGWLAAHTVTAEGELR